MPNWCEGTLKIRGTAKQVLAFVKTAFEAGEYMIDDNNDSHLFVSLKDYAWLKGSKRAFCSGYIEIGTASEDEKGVAAINFMQAWNIRTEDLLRLAQETGVDLKIYAFEQGVQFNRNIEIVDGEIVKDEHITFDNYLWDCVCPLIGG